MFACMFVCTIAYDGVCLCFKQCNFIRFYGLLPVCGETLPISCQKYFRFNDEKLFHNFRSCKVS